MAGAPLAVTAGRSGPASLLDGPPPHPQMQQSPFGAGGFSAAPARQLPPEVIQGLLQSGSTIGEMLDMLAQTAPDAAVEFAAAKDMVQRGLAKLMTAGGGMSLSTPPTGPLPGATPVGPLG